MTVEIPLRRKYLVGGKSRFSGGENYAPKKKRVKIGHDAHVRLFGEPPGVVLRVDGRTGKSVLEKV